MTTNGNATQEKGLEGDLRLYFIAFVMVMGLSALVGRLWWLQVAHGERWTRRMSSRSEVTVRIPCLLYTSPSPRD